MSKFVRNIAFVFNNQPAATFNHLLKRNFCGHLKKSSVKSFQLINTEKLPLFNAFRDNIFKTIINGFNIMLYENKYDRQFSLQKFHDGSMKVSLNRRF